MKKLIVIVPCYNESDVFAESLRVLCGLIAGYVSSGLIAQDSFVCFVDDGSRDDTWSQIESACADHKGRVAGVKLSRNFGHQAALLAAMDGMHGKADFYITIDADLQDDPTVISEMIQKAAQGANIVYGVRRCRDTDSWFKRTSAVMFYRLMRFMGVDMVFNHADFRLFDNRVLSEMLEFREANLFLRGIFPLIGFRSDTVHYDRQKRIAGESKYTLLKMITFAWDGITSFSVRPMRAVLHVGIVSMLIACVILVWVFCAWLSKDVVSGWTSMIGVVTFFGGVQMISIGVIGEYVGKTYKEVKRRPRYIIEKTQGENI